MPEGSAKHPLYIDYLPSTALNPESLSEALGERLILALQLSVMLAEHAVLLIQLRLDLCQLAVSGSRLLSDFG